ncbi:hypothetical protein ACS0TY_013350 [Phlomoides rotata]
MNNKIPSHIVLFTTAPRTNPLQLNLVTFNEPNRVRNRIWSGASSSGKFSSNLVPRKSTALNGKVAIAPVSSTPLPTWQCRSRRGRRIGGEEGSDDNVEEQSFAASFSSLNLGYTVKAFDLKTSDISSLPPLTHGATVGGSFEIVYGDVTDYPSLFAAFSGCHVIFHAAALVEFWIPDPARFFLVNVGGLKNALKAYKETDTIEKIIYTSSFFALGSTDGYIGDETKVHDAKHCCTEYEKSKMIADKIALDAAAEGVPLVPVYPGLIYGPGKVTSGNSLSLLLIERFKGLIPGYFGQEKKVSFSHVDDVVNGHIAAMAKGRLGERYLLTGEIASFKDVFDMAAEITHTPKPRFSILCFRSSRMVVHSFLQNNRGPSLNHSTLRALNSLLILRGMNGHTGVRKPRKRWIIIPEV